MMNARFFRICAAALSAPLVVALAAGCPGTLTEEEKAIFQGGGTCPDVPAMLTAKCGTANCHAAGSATVDLASPNMESRLVSVAGTESCGSVILANPIDAAGSLIYAKLLDPPPCGLKMPLGGSMSDLEINCVKLWIESLDP
ncbi:MAG TPA: hypothetical protein VM694_10600, partial [Polyangium sp.]|nr:hypothetical protein [Polyangium sp.]